MTASAAWHRHREEITMANPDTYHLLLGLLSFQIVLLRTGIKTKPNPILVQNMRCEMMADPFS